MTSRGLSSDDLQEDMPPSSSSEVLKSALYMLVMRRSLTALEEFSQPWTVAQLSSLLTMLALSPRGRSSANGPGCGNMKIRDKISFKLKEERGQASADCPLSTRDPCMKSSLLTKHIPEN
ncbi:hypothetical protein HHK36_024775 [Tetracentron sinense]|uniref:Uncharacterized protein n=1 Tax=Tetracentron sinense TaxID=13715 RepID=A0A834YLQ2_TETSI|nr:hypothetical protein HHK36_024775 [Tetracentron sinense]